MSTKITSSIWDLRGIPATTKLILIKLGDNANDKGICWPSVPRIAQECEVSERTVQGAIIWAEKNKLLTRKMQAGKVTVYHITPAEFAPPQILRPADYDITPADSAPPPPQITTYTPADYGVTHIEPSREPPVEPSREPPVVDDWFERFWEAFPRQRRGGREKAIRSWSKAIKKTEPEIIHAGVIRYSTSRDVQRGFAKGAAAWLNDTGWEYQPVASNSNSSFNGKSAYGDSIANAANTVLDHIRREENLREEENNG